MGKIPTKIKKLKGTSKPSREMKNEMMPPTIDSVEKPSALINDFATIEWDKTTRILNGLNMLHETDTSLLLAYCNEMGMYFKCCEHIRDNGITDVSPANGVIISNHLKAGNTALQNAIKLADKFGFNPAARTKIEMPTKKPKDDFADL